MVTFLAAAAYPGDMLIGSMPSMTPMGRTVVVSPNGASYSVDLMDSSLLSRFQPVTRSDSSPSLSRSQENKQARVRRTFKELSRELECPHDQCKRRYASRSSLATHLRLKHSPEAKQQQEEDAQRQAHRRRSMEKPVTPRPVRPRAIGMMPMDMLRRQTICAGLPMQVYSLPGSPMGSPGVQMQMPLSSHSLVDLHSFSMLEHSMSSPMVYGGRPSFHGSVASGMSPSPVLSSASTPTLSFVNSPSADASLAQPIYNADVLDDLLLSQLNLNLAALDASIKAEENASSLLSEFQDMDDLLRGASSAS